MRLRRRPSPFFRRFAAAGVLATLVAAAAPAALADDYDPDRAGHPLRIVAYVVHPIGVAFEWLVMRPAHWVVNHEPFSTIFGHEEGRLYTGEKPEHELED